MIRVLLLIGIALFLILALTLSVILMQPRDDAAMRALLAASPSCSAPCFLGIRPGVTTAQQAIAILQTHPWVKGFGDAGREPPSHPQDYSTIVWDWSGQQPDFLLDASGSAPYLHINNGVVQYIRLVTRIPYGDAWLTMGAPNTGTLIVGGDSALQSASYFGGKLVFDSKVTCPIKPALVWNAPISITYSDGSTTAYYSQSVFHLDRAYYHSKCPS